MREDNIEIFKDTERLCKTNAALANAIKESSAAQKLFLEGASKPKKRRRQKEL